MDIKNKELFYFHLHGRIIIFIICFIIIITATTVLIGWLFNFPIMTSLVPPWNPMSMNAAFCFILSAVALLMIQYRDENKTAGPVSIVFAATIMLIASITFYEFFSGVNLTANPYILIDFNQMALSTAVGFFLVSVVIILLNIKKINPWIYQLLTWAIFIIGFFEFTTYVVGVQNNLQNASMIVMSFPTSIMFMFLSLGILLTNIEVGMTKILFADDIIGKSLRLMLPFILFVPIILVIVESWAAAYGLYDKKYNDVIDAIGGVVVFTVVFALIARLLKEEQSSKELSEKKLRDTELLFKDFADNVDVVFFKTDVYDTKVFYISPAFTKIWGYRTKELYDNPKLWFETIVLQDQQRILKSIRDFSSNPENAGYEFRIRHKNGSVRDIYAKVFHQFDDNKNPIYRMGIAIEVTEILKLKKYNQIEEKIIYDMQNEKNLSKICGNALQTICDELDWDAGEMLLLNEDKQSLRSVSFLSNKKDNLKLNKFGDTRALFNFGEGLPGEIWKNKQTIWVTEFQKSTFLRSKEAIDAGILTAFGTPIQYRAKFIGVIDLFKVDSEQLDQECLHFIEKLAAILAEHIEMIETESEVNKISRLDVATGLLNIRTFEDNVNKLINSKKLQSAALLIIDLERFHLILDSFGPQAANGLIKEVGKRLKLVSNLDVEYIAHFSADKFVLFSEIKSSEHIQNTLSQIRTCFDEPFQFETENINLSVFIGISIYPKDGSNARELLDHANQALYYAKELGSMHIQYYSTHMLKSSMDKIKLEKDLRRALEHKEFSIFCQPIIDLSANQIAGGEILVRWQHPDKGLILPNDFIPYAEETGLIVPISEHIIQSVFNLMAPNWEGPPLSINISTIQFKNGFHLLHFFEQLIETYKVDPSKVELEITESVLIRDIKHNVELFAALHNLGFRFSLDDFGTGFSSFGYLPRLPISKVKIDRTFIKDLPSNNGNQLIVRAIIRLMHSLNMKVVAEGVETEGELEFLIKENCDFVQGFYYYKPMPFNDFLILIKK